MELREIIIKKTLLECIKADQVQTDSMSRPLLKGAVQFSQCYISEQGLLNEITEEAQGRQT